MIVFEAPGESASIDTDHQVFSYFEVEMGDIHATVGADGADFLVSSDELAFTDCDGVEVGVKGINGLDSVIFPEGMTDDDDIAPTFASIASINDDAVSDGIHRITQVGIAALETIPIVTEVAVGAKSAVFVVAFCIWRVDREIEAVSKWDDCGGGRLCRANWCREAQKA